MTNTISDLPKGPLDPYRESAKFDWKLLKLNLDGDNFLNAQVFCKKYDIYMCQTIDNTCHFSVVLEKYMGLYRENTNISKICLFYIR